ncbi:MAG: type II toxin-antitoxin system RelE/ParE family toxin [Wenzhouxiangella sp.]
MQRIVGISRTPSGSARCSPNGAWTLRVRWTTPAADDLEVTQSHYLEQNPEAARAMADRVFEAIEMLKEQPLLGRPGLQGETREWVVRHTPYVLVYRVGPEAIEIVHVWHGARNWWEG